MSDEIAVISHFQGMVHTFDMAMGAGSDKELRVKLIQEEAQEFIDAVKVRNVVETIDAICDLLYVTYGAAHVLKAGAMGLADNEYENWPVKNRTPNWPALNSELDDFNITINSVIDAIRTGSKERMHLELKDLVEGLWQCAAEGVGVDLKPFFKEVHRTNMNKLQGPKREDGKQLKPAGWKPPRIEALYLRWRDGKQPQCNVIAPLKVYVKDHAFNTEYRIEHKDGGYCCSVCGGLFVEWELSYSEDMRRGKIAGPDVGT